MFMNFNTFTRYFFYLFLCYHYAKYHYPEKTQRFLIIMGYNSIYLYSKLQIVFNKKVTESHNFLTKYENYQKLLLFLEKVKETLNVLNSCETPISSTNQVTLDFVLDSEINFSFEKGEFLDDYLSDFFPDDATDDSDDVDDATEDNADEQNSHSKSDSIIDYDFIIINGHENLKKIIKHIDLIKNDFESADSEIFQLEPFLYKPMLCELWNGDAETIEIDFRDNNKFYDFLVVGNCFDKTFLTYFVKKYYEVELKENYFLKILDNNVNSLLFESSDVVKLDKNCISKL